MANSDSLYNSEELYSRESTEPDGILKATERERVFGWYSFLDHLWKADVPIVAPSELEGGSTCRFLGRGATMVVSERVWKSPQSDASGGVGRRSTVIALKRLIIRLSDSGDDLRPRPQHEFALLANFALELRALCHGALRSHTNIVRLLGVTWAEKGLPALIMERASEDFATLQTLIENRKLCGTQKADILAGIADGLGAIHSLTLVHGDLKPANVLMFEQGTKIIPKLSDFAFARSWKETLPSGGTEFWNAPECCEFRSQKTDNDNDHASHRDLFSLGLMFWYVLNDRIPFAEIGAEIDNSNESRRKITSAKETGYLLKQLELESSKYEAFMFRGEQKESDDDEDATLSVVECMKHLLQPQPSKRLNRYETNISEKLRTRTRLLESSTLQWDGKDLSGDIWPGLEKDIEDLKLRAQSRSKVETGIRFRLDKELEPATRVQKMPLKQSTISPDVSSMIKDFQETTLKAKDISKEEQAEAAWHLAQLQGRSQSEKRRELLLEAARLGHQHGQGNYLYHCFRDGVPLDIDEETHQNWLVTSLTGEFMFNRLEPYPVSPLQNRISHGFHKFYGEYFTGSNSRKHVAVRTDHRIAILHEAFVRDVLGKTYPPHDQILSDRNRWATIVSAKERTFEKFRTGLGDLKQVVGPDALHTTAVFGTGDVIRDLIKSYKLDLETQARTKFHPEQATALQAAFLRHNMSTVQALVDLGADILVLFSSTTLEAFLIEGDRDLLHWLNHLIPLMQNKKNAAKARANFDSILLSSRAVQRTVVQSNWSLFLGILELRQPLTDGELKPALEIAACTRRTEFVLALLVLDSDHGNVSEETLVHVLCQACRPRQEDCASKPVFPRHFLGLQPEFVQSVKTSQDIAYGQLIAEIILSHAITRNNSKVKDIRSFLERPLFQAVFFNRMALAKEFIKGWGADPVRQNEDGETILSFAIFKRNAHAVKYILELLCASELIQNRNFLGDGPLQLAAAEGDSRIIKMLLRAGASSTSQGFLGRNVLHICASHVNKRAFCTLFEHIELASPSTVHTMMNQKAYDGATPFHLLLQGSDAKQGIVPKPVLSQDRNIARMLSNRVLKYVANINQPDDWDLTPMHYLALFHEDLPQTTLMLHRRGADLLKQSSYIGATPFQMLMESGKRDTCAAIIQSAEDSEMDMDFLTRAMTGGYASSSKVLPLLEGRRQKLKQQEEQSRQQLRAKFNVRKT